jgi:hypothetical protein
VEFRVHSVSKISYVLCAVPRNFLTLTNKFRVQHPACRNLTIFGVSVLLRSHMAWYGNSIELQSSSRADQEQEVMGGVIPDMVLLFCTTPPSFWAALVRWCGITLHDTIVVLEAFLPPSTCISHMSKQICPISAEFNSSMRSPKLSSLQFCFMLLLAIPERPWNLTHIEH